MKDSKDSGKNLSIENSNAESFNQYEGDDKVVTSYELRDKLLSEKTDPRVNVKALIHGIDYACEGFQDGELIIISGPTKQGKCMKKGTKLLMHDGSIRRIEDVKVGDLLMGDDSVPRAVLSTCSGVDELFKIIPWQGDSYSVNKEHILCLERCQTTHRKTDNLANSITEVSVKNYLEWSKWQKHIHKTYRVAVNFPLQEVPYSPYILGLWLGDGHSHTSSFTTEDCEIVECLENFCLIHNFRLSIKIDERSNSNDYRICGRKQGENKFLEFLKNNNLLGNKHIPDQYKINSEENRLLLLAGLIDTDGNYAKSTRGGALEFVSKSEILINDVAFLCRSLGFSCTPHKIIKSIKALNFTGEYWKMRISGDISRIPCLLSRKTINGMKTFKRTLRSAFKIESDGVGEYYGFTLDGNGRYLLADFQVTHNTLLAQTLTVNFAKQKHHACWFSYEVPARQFLDQFPILPLFYLPQKNVAMDFNWLMERCIEAHIKYNTRIFFIDHLHFLVDMARVGNPSLEIGAIVRRVKRFAVENDFIIFLLAHIKKNESDDISYRDLRDSSFIAQDSDTVIMIKRTPKEGQTRAKARVEFHRRTGIIEWVTYLDKKHGLLWEVIENA